MNFRKSKVMSKPTLNLDPKRDCDCDCAKAPGLYQFIRVAQAVQGVNRSVSRLEERISVEMRNSKFGKRIKRIRDGLNFVIEYFNKPPQQGSGYLNPAFASYR